MGYVYVAEAGKYCKIGISEKSVEQRMRTIQTGCPVNIERIWCSRNIPDYLGCEKLLHNRFAAKKSHGEWFEITFFEAAEEAEKICRSGVDKKMIETLETENRELKAKLSEAFTKEDLIKAFMKLLDKE